MNGMLPVLIAGLISIGGIFAAYGQEVRGTYIVDIPTGAYLAGAEHDVPANIAIPTGTTIS